jgi:hypothetical protein
MPNTNLASIHRAGLSIHKRNKFNLKSAINSPEASICSIKKKYSASNKPIRVSSDVSTFKAMFKFNKAKPNSRNDCNLFSLTTVRKKLRSSNLINKLNANMLAQSVGTTFIVLHPSRKKSCEDGRPITNRKKKYSVRIEYNSSEHYTNGVIIMNFEGVLGYVSPSFHTGKCSLYLRPGKWMIRVYNWLANAH